MPNVSFKVHLSNGQIKEFSHDFDSIENQTLFEICDNQGVKLNHGCLAGSCSACKSYVRKGISALSKRSSIEANTIDSLKHLWNESEIMRLTCRSKIKSFEPLIEIDQNVTKK